VKDQPASDAKTTAKEEPRPDAGNPVAESDNHLGALETDKPGQPGQGNRNLPALDENGRPSDWKKICEDVIGANTDQSEGG
jgi:hypothetical protein